MSELANIGIILEITGFVIFLQHYILRVILYFVKAYKKELHKPAEAGDVVTELGTLDYNTYASTHRKYSSLHDAAIILIILGLIFQFEF